MRLIREAIYDTDVSGMHDTREELKGICDPILETRHNYYTAGQSTFIWALE